MYNKINRQYVIDKFLWVAIATCMFIANGLCGNLMCCPRSYYMLYMTCVHETIEQPVCASFPHCHSVIIYWCCVVIVSIYPSCVWMVCGPCDYYCLQVTLKMIWIIRCLQWGMALRYVYVYMYIIVIYSNVLYALYLQ